MYTDKKMINEMKRLRIGIFTDTFSPQINGVSTSIKMLIFELEKKGHSVFVVSPNNETDKTVIDINTIRICGKNILNGTDYKFANILFTGEIEEAITLWNLDIIHTHTEFAIGLLGTYIAYTNQIPIVHTYHTMYEECMHYITDIKPLKKITLNFFKMYIKHFASVCHSIIVPTEKAKNILKEYDIKQNITVIPTGIDSEAFKQTQESAELLVNLKKQLNISEKDFVIVTIGRLSKEKNFELIINSINKKNIDNSNLKLIIIGDGPLRKDLEILAKKSQNNVIFVGKIPWHEVALYYHLGDVFVTASRAETQGLTVIEALYSSLPVICPNDEAFSKIVVQGVNGYLYDNDEQLLDKIIQLSQNPKIVKELSINASSCSKLYSSDQFSDNVLKEYYRVLMHEYGNEIDVI